MKFETRALLLSVLFLVGACSGYSSGDNSQGQLGLAGVGDPIGGTEGWINPAIKWAKLEAGSSMSCGIRYPDGTLWCWGDNSRGQMGNGVIGGNVLTPQQVGATSGWTHVAPGFRHVCAIRAGELFCWGDDTRGQLANGVIVNSNSQPVRVGSENDWINVSSSEWHSCAIRSGGQLYCWGLNSDGQVGNGTTQTAPWPTHIASNLAFASVGAGYNHSCAITDDSVLLCWGSNAKGQLGIEQISVGAHLYSPQISFPVGAGDWGSLSVGRETSCAIRKDNPITSRADPILFCWGDNEYGQVTGGTGGTGSLLSKPKNAGFYEKCDPAACYEGQVFVSAVTAGGEHVCFIESGIYGPTFILPRYDGHRYEDRNEVRCWGSNNDGQLNVQDAADFITDGDAVIVSLSAGFRFTLMSVLSQ